MKLLTWKLVLPLTAISFAIFTKWWYVLPEDAPDSMMVGFPLPFICDGWHTSMSLQIFVAEFVFDLFIYFLCWLLIIFIINRYLIKIKMPTIVTVLLLSVVVLIIAATTFVMARPEHIYTLKREFSIEIMETGYQFNWQPADRPDFYKYHPAKK